MSSTPRHYITTVARDGQTVSVAFEHGRLGPDAGLVLTVRDSSGVLQFGLPIAHASAAIVGTVLDDVDTAAVMAEIAVTLGEAADADEPDFVTFSLDNVVARLKLAGVDAYVEHTGGGCATIYAGGKHTVTWSDGQVDERHDVAAGPGTYGSNTATTAEFFVGPNDDEGGEHADITDERDIRTATDAERRVAAMIIGAVTRYAERTDAEWQRTFAG